MTATATATAAYDQLATMHLRVHRLGHLQSIASWDQAAFMPPGGAEARAEALAEMATLLHGLQTDARLAGWLEAAAAEPLDDWQRANLREMRRQWEADNALPAVLVERQSLAASRCEHAWRSQRPANDWTGFAANLVSVVALAREQAALLAERSGLSLYDGLLDRYEPGMRSAELDRLFGPLRSWLPPLIEQVSARQAERRPVLPQGPFPIERQRWLADRVMRLVGFDFTAGRLDVSTHPFSGGVPEDVRLTTRYREDDFLQGLMGTIHETGHGRYEQNRPRAWLGQPVSAARSMAIHESQSLAFEMQLGRSAAFAERLAPLLGEAFGWQPAFEPANLVEVLTRVEAGRIRVDADEVTYPVHVLLRYEIERALIEGSIEVADIPAWWDERMQAWLGIDTRGDFRNGPMQDVHWPLGLFGYFPCYTLGAMYAAQWFAAMRRAEPRLDERVAAGDFAPVFDWLREHVWSQASRWPTDELTRRASGGPLDAGHFRAHLEARYLGGAA